MPIEENHDDELRVFTVVNRQTLHAWLQFGTATPPLPLKSLPLRRGKSSKLDGKRPSPFVGKKAESV